MQTRGEFRLTARLYDKRGRLLATGQNSYQKSHPLQGHYAKLAGRPDAIFLHAEIDALRKCQNWDNIHRIEIERFDKQGNPVLAKPCPICEIALKEAKINEIIFTKGVDK